MLKHLDWANLSVYIIWPIIEAILFIIAPKLMLSLIIAAGVTLFVMCKRESITEGDKSWFY